ncbi:fructose-1-phosphate kinase [Clostridium sp. USBA 49]|jgi:1-phosphofructokinase|uniref:1-phosphofructokinase n=1 Tax=Clostridium sp. USBA 49 TaxID=1881060 RepID=UPI00099ABC73|nr:1-phosphofructokinase [Clostridium sp. USBA 49]SKA85867.1 fructose-1-phosphate kinase [Clostridium sp. USBA 49]
MKPLQQIKLVTVTLNPAVDKTVEINDFKAGDVNRISSIRLDAGGKGINVSKVIKSLNGESIALGILSGKNGEFIRDYLNSLNIENNFVFTKGETRTNLKIIDSINKKNTDINEPGNIVSIEDLNRLEESIFKVVNKDSILILSGSVPEGVPKDIYAVWIKKAKEQGAKTILDADGELLKEGVKAGPYLVKPNIHELEKFCNKKLESMKDIVKASEEFFKYGVERVVVSLGKDGGLFIDKDNVIHAEGIKVPVKSTVGAGDSMVAALALSIERNYSLEKAVVLSTAVSAANVMTSGTEPAELKDILELEKKVKFKYIIRKGGRDYED